MEEHVSHIEDGGIRSCRQIDSIEQQNQEAVDKNLLEFQAVILAHVRIRMQARRSDP